MIGRLALRSLTAHPVRSAVLAAGFGVGVAVMAILLGVAGIVLEQAQSPALVGGGDVEHPLVAVGAGRDLCSRARCNRMRFDRAFAPRLPRTRPTSFCSTTAERRGSPRAAASPASSASSAIRKSRIWQRGATQRMTRRGRGNRRRRTAPDRSVSRRARRSRVVGLVGRVALFQRPIEGCALLSDVHGGPAHASRAIAVASGFRSSATGRCSRSSAADRPMPN